MNDRPVARGSATRTANKIKRRENILKSARRILANQDFDAFTLNLLATEAEVTIPTIHNLIGKKSDILKELVEDMVVRIEDALNFGDAKDPILASEAFINNLISLYAKDEDFYKAAFVAGERAKLFEHELPSGVFNKALKLANQVCEQSVTEGYLLGNINSGQLAEQLFSNQRLARLDWIHGYINLATYRTQVLSGMFITIAADATPELHGRLIEKLQQLHQRECCVVG
jgi:AcrR family transcriptional regulator